MPRRIAAQFGFLIRDGFQRHVCGRSIGLLTLPLEAAGDVANDAAEEGAETPGPVGAVEDAVGAEALHEHLLDGILQVAPAGGVPPPRGQAGADQRLIAVNEFLSPGRIPRGGRFDHGPAR